jgi:hypothetical protein
LCQEKVPKKVGRKLLLKSIRSIAQRDCRNGRIVNEHIQSVPSGKELFDSLAHGGKQTKIKREEMDRAFRIRSLERLYCLLSPGPVTPGNNHFSMG